MAVTRAGAARARAARTATATATATAAHTRTRTRTRTRVTRAAAAATPDDHFTAAFAKSVCETESVAAVDRLCVCCQLEDMRLACGWLTGILCHNGHGVCIQCARRLTRLCSARCSCITQLNFQCPVCRVRTSLSPLHVLAMIKDSRDEAEDMTMHRAIHDSYTDDEDDDEDEDV